MAKISGVTLEHSNASMGPHETRIRYSLSRGDRNELFDKLASDTKVNGVMSLGEFLSLHNDGKKDEVQKVLDAYKVDTSTLPKGGGESSLTFSTESGSSYEFGDLRYFKITGYYYDSFQAVLVKEGHRDEWSPWDGPGVPKRIPKIKSKDDDEGASQPLKPHKK